MSRLKEISVSYTYTKNLGNYQSLKVDAGLVVTLEPGDDPQTVYADAWRTVRNQVEQRLNGGL
ncbi:hypothetical protein ACIFOE_20085 [Paenibacillus sp. NRS-1783]|uniref:hypothetical protein n=1 Tax=Paenibacillus sp. NRS-1783 TaxID=3233907 RepID=UPI003D271518